MGELEGIDFDAFFDCDNFSHEQAAIDNYLEQRQTKTSKMRDFNANFNKPLQKGKLFFSNFFQSTKTSTYFINHN